MFLFNTNSSSRVENDARQGLPKTSADEQYINQIKELDLVSIGAISEGF